MKERDFKSVSIVIPIFNEEENIADLYAALSAVIAKLPYTAELVFVDDGSKDKSLELLDEIAKKDPGCVVISFMRNYGQTSALAAGIAHSSSDVVVFMDADMQNDPTDIPVILEKLSEGFDVVSGWRANRKDAFINRKLPSIIANGLISRVTGVYLHDYGCTLKAYRREYLQGFKLYGEMHRFLPAYAAQNGAKIVEIPVKHHPRTKGKSKYGIGRTFKVMLDLLTVKFLSSYATKPIYLFGNVGMFLMSLAVFLVGYLLIQKVTIGTSLIQSPLLLMSAMFVILGVQSIFLGLIAELLVRTYHESQNKPPYRIKKITEFKKEQN